ELHQLEYFVAVAEEASFTRAAARVHVAQPGVSAQVRRLEAELGQQLLDRSSRSVRLTEVGAAVLPFARDALRAVSNAPPGRGPARWPRAGPGSGRHGQRVLGSDPARAAGRVSYPLSRRGHRPVGGCLGPPDRVPP